MAEMGDPMHPEVHAVLGAIGSLDDRVTDLRVQVEGLPRLMQDAVHQGAVDAVKDPLLWSSIVESIQHQARDQAGSWLFGGLRSIASRIGWLLLFIVAVWMVGGPGAVLGIIKGAFAGVGQ